MSNNIREDGGSSTLPYGTSHWDRVCSWYFEKSEINIKDFYGNVLYVGMGGAYGPRNQSKNVKNTTILEKYPEIIEKYNVPEKNWRIIEGCAYEYDFKDEKFDIIVLDIWARFIFKKEYDVLYAKYKKYLKKEGRIHTIKTLKIK